MSRKLPSTSGGAAGSLVRGNEFYDNAPAPYSNTRRGQDVIHIRPGAISVVRPQQPDEPLPPNLYFSARYSLEQVFASWGYAQTSNTYGITPFYAMRRLCVQALPATATPEQKLRKDKRTYLHTGSNARRDIGRMTYVGDGYFVSWYASTTSQYAGPKADNTGESLAILMHRDRINSPILDVRTRTLWKSGETFTMMEPGPDVKIKPGLQTRDRRGANYALTHTHDTMFRVAPALQAYASGAAAGVWTVPLGWYDPTYRFVFAVYGLSDSGAATTKYNCHIYSTGMRDLLPGPPTQLPTHPESELYAGMWVGMMGTQQSIPRMTALGRGTAAAVMLPATKRKRAGDGYIVGGHAMHASANPVLMYTTTFGHNWFYRELPELRQLALPATLTEGLAAPTPILFYPEICGQLCPLGEQHYLHFLLMVAQAKRPFDGPMPSAAYSQREEDRLNNGGLQDLGWYPGASSEPAFQRSSTLTLFRGSVDGALQRITAIDGDNILLVDPVHTLSLIDPVGRFEYRVLLNARAESPTPCLAPIGQNAAAFVYAQRALTLSGVGDLADINNPAVEHIQTVLCLTFDGGYTWRKVALPAQLLSYRDQASTNRAVALGVDPMPSWHVSHDFVSWSVAQRCRGGRANGTLVFCVEQMDYTAVYTVKLVQTEDGSIDLQVKPLTSLDAMPPLLPPGATAANMWDGGTRNPPSGVMVMGDNRTRYPDAPFPAMPKLLK